MNSMNDFSLQGKVALITGASYGIGFAIAKAMACAGATIVFNDLKQELVDKGLAAYEAEGIKAHGDVCNVCDERVQYPVQRHWTWLYCHASDCAFAGNPARWFQASL